MYKIICISIVIFTVAVTAFLCVSKPQMHKTVFMYDSEYELVSAKTETEKHSTTPVQTVAQKQTKIKTSTNTTKVQTQKTAPVKTVSQIPQTNKTVKNTKKTATQKQVSMPKQTTQKQVGIKQTQKTTQTTKPQVISDTEKIRQEEILWNKWRSDLQNKIMSDTQMPVLPQGTIFKFSFNVDKYGKITNVQTWSTNPTYTPYAIQYIAPVIRSLQGRSVLNFPAGSNRISTKVNGGWKISLTTKYSTERDFNDTERVTK